MLAFDLKLPALWQLLGEISGIGSCATPLNLKSALIGFASFLCGERSRVTLGLGSFAAEDVPKIFGFENITSED